MPATSAAEIPQAPPPWNLKGEAWWFLISTPFNRIQAPELAKGGWFDPLHEQSRKAALEPGAFLAGDGMIQLLRYHESPIGPYDELLVIPGRFKSPPGTKPSIASRITRIYVSKVGSVEQGRRNWNIPKSLAKFTFTPSADGALGVQVFAPISFDDASAPVFADTPFFAATIRRTWSLPIPLNLRYLPLASVLVQPPLEGSPDVQHDGRLLTDRWLSTDVSGFRGWMRTVKWEGGLSVTDAETGKERKRLCDGVGFPDVVPISMGLHFSHLHVVFPVPEVMHPSK